MLTVYINYPNPTISVHEDTACTNIGKMGKPGQRQIHLDTASLSTELLKFQNKEYRFGSDSTANDMWLFIDFGDAKFERAVLIHVQKLIGKHYKPLRNIEHSDHCLLNVAAF